jgi:Raf kinase inhibitor-like YbhB/YbcL family protein
MTSFKFSVISHYSLLSAVLLFALIAAMLFGCSRTPSQPAMPSLKLKSTSFSGDTIPMMYACSRDNCPCDGKDISPELSWNSPPQSTQSFSLIVTDKDALFGWGFTHWVLYNLPAEKRDLPEGIAKQEQLTDGSRQGQNGFDKIGYVGPCPPGHSAHRYVFDLYALDTKLNLPAGASKKDALKAMKGHMLASGELIGRFQH